MDTSANYTGGSSEKMVGEVVDRWRDSHNTIGPKLISKFGYTSVRLKTSWLRLGQCYDYYKVHLEGHSPSPHQPFVRFPSLSRGATIPLKHHSQKAESKLPGVVIAAPGLGHSLHPDFYRSQLASSKERLGNTAVDVYLVEHPDHHLALKLGLIGESGASGVLDMDTPSRLEEARLSFYDDMTVLFEAMEHGGGAYGVSSVGLSLPEWDPMHVSWEKLMSCAEEAAIRAGRER